MAKSAKRSLTKKLSGSQVLSDKEKKEEYFTDNFDYLQALEYEAKIRLIHACSKKKRAPFWNPEGNGSELAESKNTAPSMAIDFNLLEIPLKETEVDLAILVQKIAEKNKALAENSLRCGIELPFESFCKSFNLNPFERNVILLLFAKSMNPLIREFLEKHAPRNWAAPNGGMKIRSFLDITTSDLREQFRYRKYFDIRSSLIKGEIIVAEKGSAEINDILDVEVHLHERIFRHILGDKNTYDITLTYILRDRSPIEFERVILPENIKADVLRLAENYSRQKRVNKVGIRDFYGYGTGLTFLFQGPSGTGKTMLAHALAHRLNTDLLSLNFYDAYDQNVSAQDAIENIFKEARLSGGIVFFDECDDFFHEGTELSRSLLIEIEKSDCISILSTNQYEKLDPSIARRITLRVPFHLPDEGQRGRIWKGSVPPSIALDKDVDFQKLAKELVLTGGLIKNAIFMAIQNGVNETSGSKICLNMDELEKAATLQLASMPSQKSLQEIYWPQIHLTEMPLKPLDQKRFQCLAQVYDKYHDKDFVLNLVIGCSDIQIGIDCVDGLARECNLAVRRFSFPEIIRDQSSLFQEMGPPWLQRKVSMLENAFKICTGQESMLLFVDPDALWEQLLQKSGQGPVREFEDFKAKLRSFRGMSFFVTKPLKDQALPVEIHDYIEIKYPSEEIQIRRWETLLQSNGHSEDEIIDLVEKYPMHLNEIEHIFRQANIIATLNESEGIPRLEHFYKAISRLKGNKRMPVLFGGKK